MSPGNAAELVLVENHMQVCEVLAWEDWSVEIWLIDVAHIPGVF